MSARSVQFELFLSLSLSPTSMRFDSKYKVRQKSADYPDYRSRNSWTEFLPSSSEPPLLRLHRLSGIVLKASVAVAVFDLLLREYAPTVSDQWG